MKNNQTRKGGGSSAILHLENQNKQLRKVLNFYVAVEKVRRNNSPVRWLECLNCFGKTPDIPEKTNSGFCAYCEAKQLKETT